MAAALTTAGGFAVLNLSSLLPLRLFGQAFVIAILLALASSIILLPCLMSLFGLLPKEESTSSSYTD
jgi:predicted RND superfamily exporter protein